MFLAKRLITCQSSFRLVSGRLAPSAFVQTRNSNSQHRVVLLPEVPADNDCTNPLLKRYDSPGFPDFTQMNQRATYFGLGKALLEFEAEVAEVERLCEAGVKDFGKLFEPLEKAKCHFEGVWNLVNMLGVTTDHLDQDRFSILHRRAERALLSRINSRAIHKTLQEIKAEHLEKGHLSSDEERILDRYLLEYKHQGFELTPGKFEELNSNWMKRLVETKQQYNFRITESTGRFRHSITNPSLVQDFPVDVLRAMGSDSTQPSKGPWTVTLHPYIYDQFMAYCPDRRLRYNAHSAKVTRGSKIIDIYTSVISHVKDIRQFRLDQAVTLGYPSYVAMSMETKMAANVENIQTMIAGLLGKAKQKQEIELESLQSYAEARGFEEQLEEYDVAYFKRKQRRTILGSTDEDLRQFFPFPKVLSGVFELCQKLFSVQIEEVKPAEKVWHPLVSLYRVVDIKSGKLLSHFYLDPYIRDDKGYAGGTKGWYIPLRPHSKVAGSTPLGTLVLSFPAPNYGKPSLLSFLEVEELLRNFGNLLIHSLATNQWSDLSGRTGVEWDALDLPGRFMTHWLYNPDVVNLLSGHWSTNEPINAEVVDKLCNAAHRQHLAGYTLCEELFLAAYDLAFYTVDYDSESYMDLVARLRPQYLLLPPINGDEFPLYFQEMLGGNSPASIFCSTWANMLAADAFSAVLEATDSEESKKIKVYDQEAVRKVTNRFRSTFLSLGSALPMAETFRKFRGRDPSHEALLYSLGLKSGQQPRKKTISSEDKK